MPTVAPDWSAYSHTGDSLSDFSIDESVAGEHGTEHHLLPRKGGGKGGGGGGKGKGGKGRRIKNRDTDFGKAFKALNNAQSAVIARLRS